MFITIKTTSSKENFTDMTSLSKGFKALVLFEKNFYNGNESLFVMNASRGYYNRFNNGYKIQFNYIFFIFIIFLEMFILF